MKNIYLRLDDACPYLNLENWARIEELCDKYGIKPLVGVIPLCESSELMKWGHDKFFWNKTIERWKTKQWTFALHGYKHVYLSTSGGINPVNAKSEYAGVPLNEQIHMINDGLAILKEHGIEPNVFFAPAHTFDMNTLEALKTTPIKIISDTVANKPYQKYGFTFVPVQSGRVRKLPFKSVTFCYHPNTMIDADFELLEDFAKKNVFSEFPLSQTSRHRSLLDILFNKLYFLRQKKKKK